MTDYLLLSIFSCKCLCQSPVNKLSSLNFFFFVHLSNSRFSETCMAKRFFNNEIIPTGYSIYQKNRSSRGDGILVNHFDILNFQNEHIHGSNGDMLEDWPDNLNVILPKAHAEVVNKAIPVCLQLIKHNRCSLLHEAELIFVINISVMEKRCARNPSWILVYPIWARWDRWLWLWSICPISMCLPQ